ncbi:hypothetical protein PILCRDRAFT_617738 [Piloderma croceum F 1598]|uniref:Uncharacterized protein n=1 Tax=Piloderma croceum (strain F 1598) TaxID=765440 RepID=A0A0C3AUD2_PILCF|nr:hypothetical protein PILCRDRAFT_617738 [Piloderma croceum F 1598]
MALWYNHRSQFRAPNIPLLYQIRPCAFLYLRISTLRHCCTLHYSKICSRLLASLSHRLVSV